MDKTTAPSIFICLGSSCYSRGNAENLQAIKKFLEERNLDNQIDFRGHLCNETCNKGPVIKIDDTEYTGVTQSNLPAILSQHFD